MPEKAETNSKNVVVKITQKLTFSLVCFKIEVKEVYNAQLYYPNTRLFPISSSSDLRDMKTSVYSSSTKMKFHT